MSGHKKTAEPRDLDLSRWRVAPIALMAIGGLGALIAAFTATEQFAYSWLLAFMFFLSLSLGGLFLTLAHHLFDASWSTPIRRINENLAGLLPVMAALFIPIALLAKTIYPWMSLDAHADHALGAKYPLFTIPMFYVVAAFCFGAWWWLSSRLKHWSVKQDETGAAECTYKLRFLSYIGIFLFAITLTLGAIMWMKALAHHWFSTMYGVYYFAGSVWTTLATVYLITRILERTGHLRGVLHNHQYYYLGSLLFAFTVFYAYIHFSQYFIIWNANIPEETFWYVLREKGAWWDVGMIIIFGHFFIPFLLLLRIDAKETLWLMAPLAVWAWLMHGCDLSFNIMPVIHPDGPVLGGVLVDVCCWLFMAGLLSFMFVRNFAAHAPYPVKDPRLAEAVGIPHLTASQISGGELDEVDAYGDGEQAEGESR